jgi:hypothetical protein
MVGVSVVGVSLRCQMGMGFGSWVVHEGLQMVVVASSRLACLFCGGTMGIVGAVGVIDSTAGDRIFVGGDAGGWRWCVNILGIVSILVVGFGCMGSGIYVCSWASVFCGGWDVGCTVVFLWMAWGVWMKLSRWVWYGWVGSVFGSS